jgi:hypothetical protein
VWKMFTFTAMLWDSIYSHRRDSSKTGVFATCYNMLQHVTTVQPARSAASREREARTGE